MVQENMGKLIVVIIVGTHMQLELELTILMHIQMNNMSGILLLVS